MASERVLNWGLLSTARINRALIPVLQKSKRNRVTTVASRDHAKAAAYAAEWKIERALGSYEALLEDPQIDVLYISLPNHLHAEWSIKALQAGKHVLCEKPLALSVEELDTMAAAARQSGKALAEAFMYRHHPQTLKAKEIAESGQLGALQLLRGTFAYTQNREADVRLNKEMGGGSIWDVGCYPISFARLLAGSEPVEVHGWQSLGAGGIDMTFVGEIRYASGALAQFDSSFVTPYRVYMEVVGSEGVLQIPSPWKPGQTASMTVKRNDGEQTVFVKAGELYSGEVEDMADAVLLGKPPRISLEESRSTVATIRALIRSAEENRIVKVDA